MARIYPILLEAQVYEDFSEIKRDLQKIGIAFHICELVDGLCPEGQENEAVFNLLMNTLADLLRTKDLISLIHDFEVELLTLLGYWHGSNEVSAKLDTDYLIESIIERRLKSKRIFSKMY